MVVVVVVLVVVLVTYQAEKIVARPQKKNTVDNGLFHHSSQQGLT